MRSIKEELPELEQDDVGNASNVQREGVSGWNRRPKRDCSLKRKKHITEKENLQQGDNLSIPRLLKEEVLKEPISTGVEESPSDTCSLNDECQPKAIPASSGHRQKKIHKEENRRLQR